MDYGLIGQKVDFSFSKLIHEKIGGYSYDLCSLPTKKEFTEFFENRNFKAINITIPYKQDVIPYCDELDDGAKKIGAVNTIVNKNGKLYGYNTDIYGILYLFDKLNVAAKDKKIMILGTGGTQKTAKAAIELLGGGNVVTVSRTKTESTITYEQAQQLKDVQIIINTSPVGMYPETENCPISLDNFDNLEGVIDVIYNPISSRLVQNAKAKGVKAVGGLGMLVAQAVHGKNIFTNNQNPTNLKDEISETEKWLCAKQSNLVLIGMPSCGKTSLGKAASKLLSKQFIDIDEIIEQEAQMSIPQIFEKDGEKAFRALEKDVIAKQTNQTGKVVSTGGGSILNHENVINMRQNGVLVYIKRPLNALATGGDRPLSTSAVALAEMYQARAPIYEAASDFTVENIGEFEEIASQIKEQFYEYFNN